MRLVVTGAGGMLGRDVVLAAQLARHDVRALDRVHLDITQEEAVQRAVADFRPGAVINCAAYTAVNDAE
ncbi:MAG: sugar nucleotide-binding protein, partial [Conexibacter sp.]